MIGVTKRAQDSFCFPAVPSRSRSRTGSVSDGGFVFEHQAVISEVSIRIGISGGPHQSCPAPRVALVAVWHAGFNLVIATAAATGLLAAVVTSDVILAAVALVVAEMLAGHGRPMFNAAPIFQGWATS